MSDTISRVIGRRSGRSKEQAIRTIQNCTVYPNVKCHIVGASDKSKHALLMVIQELVKQYDLDDFILDFSDFTVVYKRETK